eukprot:TCONS_00054308-protein
MLGNDFLHFTRRNELKYTCSSEKHTNIRNMKIYLLLLFFVALAHNIHCKNMLTPRDRHDGMEDEMFDEFAEFMQDEEMADPSGLFCAPFFRCSQILTDGYNKCRYCLRYPVSVSGKMMCRVNGRKCGDVKSYPLPKNDA